jgi:predicted DsbA family dithiol-disulfide isomerase
VGAALKIDIWSDVVCPWCYIGKRKFETALQELAAAGDDIAVDVRYHAFQLDPTAPPGVKQSVPDAYARKFGGPEQARRAIDRVTSIAAEAGLEFRLDIAQRANTLLAHRLLWLAAQPGSPATQAEMKERLLRAYFCEGLDVGDPDTLIRCASEIGFDAESVRGWLDSDAGVAEVAGEISEAAELGITAVPTFVINGQWAVPGAQDADTWVNVLRRLHAKANAA